MRQGFTLIELMIVIAIIAIIAAIAVPNLMESRVTANESAAAATLKSGVFASQVTYQGAAYQDTDLDNVGEFAHIDYLTGVTGSTGVAAGELSLVQGPLANQAANVALKPASGYFFSCWTPNNDNSAKIMEGTAVAAAITDPAAELNWACTAAPNRYGDTGRRVFFISHEGQVRSPSAVARLNTWFTGSDPAANPVPVVASITAGLEDALTTATDLGGGFATTYPVYSK